MEFYLTAILSAADFDQLNQVMEEAAFDDDITNSDYQALYTKAVEKARNL